MFNSESWIQYFDQIERGISVSNLLWFNFDVRFLIFMEFPVAYMEFHVVLFSRVWSLLLLYEFFDLSSSNWETLIHGQGTVGANTLVLVVGCSFDTILTSVL